MGPDQAGLKTGWCSVPPSRCLLSLCRHQQTQATASGRHHHPHRAAPRVEPGAGLNRAMRNHGSRTDFEWVYTDGPHNGRRQEILGKIVCLSFRSGRPKARHCQLLIPVPNSLSPRLGWDHPEKHSGGSGRPQEAQGTQYGTGYRVSLSLLQRPFSLGGTGWSPDSPCLCWPSRYGSLWPDYLQQDPPTPPEPMARLRFSASSNASRRAKPGSRHLKLA